MSDTVGDVILSRLRDWDVRQVCGYPEGGINGLLATWQRADNKPQFVQVCRGGKPAERRAMTGADLINLLRP